MKLFVILISFVYGTAICCYALGILPKPAIDSGANDRRKAPVVTTTEYELLLIDYLNSIDNLQIQLNAKSAERYNQYIEKGKEIDTAIGDDVALTIIKLVNNAGNNEINNKLYFEGESPVLQYFSTVSKRSATLFSELLSEDKIELTEMLLLLENCPYKPINEWGVVIGDYLKKHKVDDKVHNRAIKQLYRIGINKDDYYMNLVYLVKTTNDVISLDYLLFDTLREGGSIPVISINNLKLVKELSSQ